MNKLSNISNFCKNKVYIQTELVQVKFIQSVNKFFVQVK